MRKWKMISFMLAGAMLIVAAAGGAAQERLRAGNIAMEAFATRSELRTLLDRLERALTTNARPENSRADVRRSMARIRTRLREGDFSVGDRILVAIGGEQGESDTLTVQSGRVIALDDIGELSLAGVLRSELETHLTTQIGRFIRDPLVRVRVLIPLAITGQVEDPGFYLLSPDALLTEAIMAAGGPTREAELNEIRVKRGDRAILESDRLEQAIAKGWTLDRMDLHAGDRVVVPRQDTVDGGELLRMLLLAVPSAILAAGQIF